MLIAHNKGDGSDPRGI